MEGTPALGELRHHHYHDGQPHRSRCRPAKILQRAPDLELAHQRSLDDISIMLTMTGMATTPLTMAHQYSALIGLT